MTPEIYRAEHFAEVQDSLHVPRLDGEFVFLWNRFVPLSPRMFYEHLALEIDGLAVQVSLYPTGAAAITATLDHEGAEVLFSEIAFDFQKRGVNLAELRVDPAHQGRGLFKIFMRNLIQLSKALNLKGIDLQATDGGAYAFAKLGVLPTQEAWFDLREQLRKRVDALPFTDAERQHILGLLESDDPRTIWKISDL